jgi:ribosome biogenesis protein Nip4
METLEQETLAPIIEQIRARGNNRLAAALETGSLRLVRDLANRLHLVSRLAAETLLAAPLAPDAYGEPWGTLEDKKWVPSLAAVVRIGTKKPFKRVVVSASAAQHFLYKKGVHKQGILERDSSLKPGDEAWVADPTGLPIGRARIAVPNTRSLDVLQPLDDLGWYLREGG